jgi:hypothetical protein
MANATVTVLEADGTTETDVVVLDVGRQAAAASKSTAMSTEDKSQLDAAVTALQILDNVVSGSEAQVDVVAALPAGDNLIGRTKISDGTNVATVKAASTAPAAADTALVVSISPNTAIVSEAYSASATFTPAAASHVAGDCNGAAAEFASIGPNAGSVMITSATLYIDNTAAEATAWRVHLYNVTPTSAIADDSPWDFADADVTQYLGSFDFPSTATDAGANQWAQADGINKHVKLTGTSVFGYLINLTTLTPAAAAHRVILHSVLL